MKSTFYSLLLLCFFGITHIPIKSMQAMPENKGPCCSLISWGSGMAFGFGAGLVTSCIATFIAHSENSLAIICGTTGASSIGMGLIFYVAEKCHRRNQEHAALISHSTQSRVV